MAHNLNVTNGEVRMAYAAKSGAPWHGLGKAFDRLLTSDDLVGTEGPFRQVEVVGCPTYCILPNGKHIHLPAHRTNCRLDTEQWLGVVGSSYGLIQIGECLKKMDAMFPDKVLRYNTAGLLGRGERWWALAQLDSVVQVENAPISRAVNDVLKPYLFVSSSFDAGSKLHAMLTEIRIVCQNTLIAAIAGNMDKKQGGIKHSSKVGKRLDERLDYCGNIVKKHQQYINLARAMAAREATDKQRDTLLLTVNPKPEETTGRSATIWSNKQDAILDCIQQENKAQGGQSWWTVYNGIGGYFEHVVTYRDTAENQTDDTGYTSGENRLLSLMGGENSDRKQSILKLCLSSAGLASSN